MISKAESFMLRILKSILRLKWYTFQTVRRPRAAEAVAVGESSSHMDTDSNAETRFIAAVDARKPFWANGHGCAASGRSLALGRGCPLTRPLE